MTFGLEELLVIALVILALLIVIYLVLALVKLLGIVLEDSVKLKMLVKFVYMLLMVMVNLL